MLNRRSFAKSLLGLPFIRLFRSTKIENKSKEVTDTDILDFIVYAREQMLNVKKGEKYPTLYTSNRMYVAINNRFRYKNEILDGFKGEYGDILISVMDNVDWGDGPEYTCWLTNKDGNKNCKSA